MKYDDFLSMVTFNRLEQLKQLTDPIPEGFLESALIIACTRGYLNTVKYCVDRGVDVRYFDDSPLKHAIAHNHIEIVKYLIEECGVDPFTCEEVNMKIAKNNRYKELTEYLIGLGLNPNIRL
jgi:ankyrin repeat protein